MPAGCEWGAPTRFGLRGSSPDRSNWRWSGWEGRAALACARTTEIHLRASGKTNSRPTHTSAEARAAVALRRSRREDSGCFTSSLVSFGTGPTNRNRNARARGCEGSKHVEHTLAITERADQQNAKRRTRKNARAAGLHDLGRRAKMIQRAPERQQAKFGGVRRPSDQAVPGEGAKAPECDPRGHIRALRGQ